LITHKNKISTEIRIKAKEQFKYLTNLVSKAKSTLSWSYNNDENPTIEKKLQDISEISDQIENIKIPNGNSINQTDNNFKIGDGVLIKGINTKGILFSIDTKTHTSVIKVGNSKLRVDSSRLSPIPTPSSELPNMTISKAHSKRKSIDLGKEILDVRGTDVETAISKIDSFLNSAVRNDLSKVTIIHGKGTGTLRKHIRKNLSSHTLVEKFEPRLDSIGGDGATDITLV
jgi:DNA mismatch repair protein MutS2